MECQKARAKLKETGRIAQAYQKLRDWISRHMISALILCSILFALVVHWLFSTPAPNEWLVHKWEAGDILTYVSTIALGLLAIWQNQRFKAENDKAQERLEKISREANELNLVSKLIENERQYIAMLDQAYIELLDVAGIENIAIIMNGEYSAERISTTLKKINHATVHFLQVMASGYEIRGYDITTLNLSCLEIAKIASEKLHEYRKEREKARPFSDEAVMHYTETLMKKNEYIKRRHQTLNAILLEEMSMAEIRALYIRPEEKAGNDV